MNLDQFRKIAPAVDAEIAEVFKKYGLKVGKRGATVDATAGTISFRLTLVDTNLKDESGNATTPEAAEYKRSAVYFNMKPEWLGQTIKLGRVEYKIVGLKKGRSAKPVVVQKIDSGANYVIAVADVRKAMGLVADPTLAELRERALAAVNG